MYVERFPRKLNAVLNPRSYYAQGSECMLGDLKIYAAGKPGPKAIVVLPEVPCSFSTFRC